MQWWLRQALGLTQGAVLILAAPAFVGLLRWLKARLQLRQGPPIRQPYLDLLKLMRRPAVRPGTASLVFALTPKLLLITTGSLAFMVPAFFESTFIRADLIILIYVLALARFAISLAGLDSGAGFGGMGSGREMFFQFLTEIGLLLCAAALMIQWRTISLADPGGILAQHRNLGFGGILERPELMLLGLSFILLVVIEAGRMPIDNPAAHLELTMARQAIVLEYAGRDLALVELAEMIKLIALLTLFCGLFMPLPYLVIAPSDQALVADLSLASGTIAGAAAAGLRILLALLGLIGKLIALAGLLAIWELAQPKLRLRAVSSFSLVAIALSLITILYSITVRTANQ